MRPFRQNSRRREPKERRWVGFRRRGLGLLPFVLLLDWRLRFGTFEGRYSEQDIFGRRSPFWDSKTSRGVPNPIGSPVHSAKCWPRNLPQVTIWSQPLENLSRE